MFNAGSVTVDDAGNVSGSGKALALYNAIFAAEGATLPDPSTPDADWEDTVLAWTQAMTPVVVKAKKAWAKIANEHASTLAGRAVTLTTAIPSYQATLDDDFIGLTTRAANSAILLPAGAPIGFAIDIVDTSGNGALWSTNIVNPAGETIVGLGLTGNYERRRVTKISATAWVSHK